MMLRAPDGRHVVMMEKPDEFNRTLPAFRDRIKVYAPKRSSLIGRARFAGPARQDCLLRP